ncbi:MAG: TetR/AcrR family transcriptional regulator [Candidatus Omnitrophica bacterium]|jgi:AcrR family transcriptional regulator|nr:TetR/AcrR family transcriptional regulator [Candidatus Omnitrophota bacterium]
MNKLKGKCQNKKEQILKEAAKIFSKKGYWKTDVDSIAQKLQLGKGTIYRYFTSKEDIFISLIDRILDQLIDTLKKEIRKNDDFFKKIDSWVYIYLEFFEKNYIYFNVITQENPGLKTKIFGNFWKKVFDKGIDIENDFEIAKKEGIIKDISPKEGMFILIGMIHGLTHHWWLSNREYSLKNKSKLISETFLKGIEKDGAKNKRTYKI